MRLSTTDIKNAKKLDELGMPWASIATFYRTSPKNLRNSIRTDVDQNTSKYIELIQQAQQTTRRKVAISLIHQAEHLIADMSREESTFVSSNQAMR